MKNIIYCIVFVPIFSFSASAKEREKHITKAIFVMLSTEQNRIKTLTNDKNYKLLQVIKTDAENIALATIFDFNDNFKFCPVYFFMDTNLNKIKQKKFEDVLFTTKDYKTKNFVTSVDTNGYYIVYYGQPSAQKRPIYDANHYSYPNPAEPRPNLDTVKYQDYYGDEPPGKGLIINDSKFNQVSYICRLVYSRFTSKNSSAKKYYYNSSNFGIEYFPLAKKLSKKFKDR